MNIDKVAGTTSSSIDSTSVKKDTANDANFEQTLKNAMSNNDPNALKKACQDFEGILLDSLYKEMRATIQKSDLIPSDSGTDIFQSMLDDELTNTASKAGGIGLADILYKQLSKNLKTETPTTGTETSAPVENK